MEHIHPEDLQKFEAKVKSGLRHSAGKRHLVVPLTRRRTKRTVRDGFTVELLEGKDWTGCLAVKGKADCFTQEMLQRHKRKPLSAIIRK
jgi:hypothetical protein